MKSLLLLVALGALIDACAVERTPAEEVHVRNGIGHFMSKLESGQAVMVAYLGGSITEMSGWRNMTTDWMRKKWPKAKVTEVPAAIGGTGSGLGVFRLEHDALAKNPDLLFVEFATNDANAPAEAIWRNFDGIVQQTWAKNPKTDVVFVYTITSSMMKDYGIGKMNPAASAMEKLADHYGIPSVCFGPRVAAEVKAGRLVMSIGDVATAVPKETPDRDRLINEELKKKGRILFAKDGVHPALPGHAFYLQSIVAAFERMRMLPSVDHGEFLGKPFFDGRLAAAKMVPVDASMLKGEGWTKLSPDVPEQTRFGGRGGQFYRADRPGARLVFRFRGTRCDIYDLLAPNGANVRVSVDGRVACVACPRFDSYCWYTRLATMPVYCGKDGVHDVEIEVLEKQPDRAQVKHEATNTPKYNGTFFQPCQIMLVGELLSDAFASFANAAYLQETPTMDSSASGRRNRIALQAMLDRGGVVRVDRPGRYRISGTVFIGSNTTLACAPGVVFVKTDEEGKFSHVICNKGARTKTYDENIEIHGLEIAVNGMDVCDWSVAYGLRGQLAFFYAKNVKVKDFKCLDLGRGQFGLHFCTFENVVVEDCDIRGWKDGVHFGRGRGFRVSRCTFDTGDDPIALNAHDYATSNPELGWISEGVVEDCHDLRNPEKTVGYFCRILAGSWGEWKPGMSVRQSDSVIRPSGVYRVSMQPDGRTFTSTVVPESKPDGPNADGIVWRKVQSDSVSSCGVSNIVFRNLRLDQPRPLFSFHADDDKYSRSCYPGTSVPAQTGIRFENVKVGFKEPKEAFLFMTPVAGLEFIDCDFGNCTGVPTEATGLIDL